MLKNTEEVGDGAKTTDGTTARARRRPAQKHGLSRLIKSRSRAVLRRMDGRSTAMQAMKAYESSLLASLGGKEHLSAQELIIVELVSRDQFILEQIDTYLLSAGLFNRRKKTAYPLTVQRMTIADSLTRRLQSLGLTRRAKPLPSLTDYLAAKAEATPPVPTGEPAPGSNEPSVCEAAHE